MRHGLLLIALAACSEGATPGTPAPPSTAVGDTITIVVVPPAEWPSSAYPDRPEIVIEDAAGIELRVESEGDRTRVALPAPGDYRVGAVTEDGGCFDTAGVTSGGNAPVEVGDGDTIRLVDTGEICD